MPRTIPAPLLSVVIPAYNEAKRLPSSLQKIIRYFDEELPKQYEILVIDDGSRDRTSAVAKAASSPNLQVRVFREETNHGKGWATRRGVLAASGSYVLCTDADLSTPIDEVNKLLSRVRDEGYDVAIGSRAAEGSEVEQPYHRRALSRASNLFIRTMLGLPYRDTQCGFKLYRRGAARTLFATLMLPRFGFDYEILTKAARAKLKVAEVGVRWVHADFSTVRTRDIIQTFFDVFRVRFGLTKGQPSPRLLRFMAVGLLNTGIDTATYITLTRFTLAFAGAFVAAKFLSFLLATISSFFLNRYWTFGIRGTVHVREVARFYLSVSFALIVNISVLYVLTHVFGMYDLVALIFAIVGSFFTNYALARSWVFTPAARRVRLARA